MACEKRKSCGLFWKPVPILWSRTRGSPGRQAGFSFSGRGVSSHCIQRDEDHMTRGPSRMGWVLFDGECAFCVSWLKLWSPTLRRRGFEVDVLQADWVPEALGMTQEETLRDIRLLTPQGKSYAGADVYLQLARRIWWTWPLGFLFSLPGFNLLIWAGYRWFAANRRCVPGCCSLHK